MVKCSSVEACTIVGAGACNVPSAIILCVGFGIPAAVAGEGAREWFCDIKSEYCDSNLPIIHRKFAGKQSIQIRFIKQWSDFL